MRFKSFYLSESSKRNLKDILGLKNIIAGAAGKTVDGEAKRDNGIYFQISSVGSWSILKDKLIDALSSYDNQSKDSTNLKFVDGKITLFVKFEKNTAKFYFTKKKVEEPEWEVKDEEDKSEETKDAASNKSSSKEEKNGDSSSDSPDETKE